MSEIFFFLNSLEHYLVWFGLVWLVWFGLVWFGWFGLVWFGLVWFGLVGLVWWLQGFILFLSLQLPLLRARSLASRSAASLHICTTHFLDSEKVVHSLNTQIFKYSRDMEGSCV